MSDALTVGIDVSKARLDVCTSTGEAWQCANDAGGHQALRERLRSLSVERIVLEATGGSPDFVDLSPRSRGEVKTARPCVRLTVHREAHGSLPLSHSWERSRWKSG